MGTKSITEEATQQEQIVDDISSVGAVSLTQEIIDEQKLSALKAKSKAKQQEIKMSAKIVAKKERSIQFGVIGSGQAGSRLAETFYTLGYDAVCLNTALQDLKHIAIPDDNKLLLEGTLGGAAKELDIGRMAAETHRDAIAQLISDKLSASQMNILTLSLGGGSGAGSCETLVDILVNTGKPLIVITVLPMENEDAQTKSNALLTLSKLAEMTQSKKIANLICVDNAKIEAIYHNVSQVDFYQIANKAIVAPLDTFNTLSSMPSFSKPLDPMEFVKLLIDGNGLSIYGEMTVENYGDDTAIAEAVINNLNSNLLASGFDIKASRYVGAMFVANKETWSKIPSSSVNYAMSMINDQCGAPLGVFKGMYIVDMPENVVKVYSMFSGLSLPDARVEQLKKDASELSKMSKDKDEARNLSLKIDTGTEENISAAQQVKNKIAAKSSTFGKFVSGVGKVSDRRK